MKYLNNCGLNIRTYHVKMCVFLTMPFCFILCRTCPSTCNMVFKRTLTARLHSVIIVKTGAVVSVSIVMTRNVVFV